MTKKPLSYQILAYYHFTQIHDPYHEVEVHKAFCEKRDIFARVYISEKGINGQMSASHQAAVEYIEWMRSHPSFQGIEFKVEPYHEHVFPKLIIKYRKQLVALDIDVDTKNGGQYVTPQQWREMLENDDDRVLLDVRNDYEWKVGRFKDAELPTCGTFRDFQTYAEELKTRVDAKKTPVMMYCTGGIRCEVYSAYLKTLGIENIYQLHGGIINYGVKEGSKHWQGKLFVFDDRMTTPISNEKTEVIGSCHHCNTPSENYYNCANMNCNYLFLSCSSCLEKYKGCCKDECCTSPKLRPFHHQNPHKPFRKWYTYFKEHSKFEKSVSEEEKITTEAQSTQSSE
jgi:UPF0176 protein